MKKLSLYIACISILAAMLMTAVSATPATTHTVVSGDTMWKIAVRY